MQGCELGLPGGQPGSGGMPGGHMASLLQCYCRRGRGVLGVHNRAQGVSRVVLAGGRGPQLSSSGTGAAAGLLLLSSVSPAGRSRAGLGLECLCLRMKGKTLWAEWGQH